MPPTDCNIPHNPADLILTLSITLGIVLSYLPQHLRIVKLGSSEGISPWYLLMGGVASVSNLTNVSILQAPYISCCTSVSKGQCLANLLGLVQMTVQWLMFQIIFILYFKMYPDRLKYKYSTSTSNTPELSDHWLLSLKIKLILKVYSFLLACLIFALGLSRGFPSGSGTALAWGLGILSMVLSVLQFIPQIHQTFQHKEIGALSIPAMLMQTPGSFIFCYTLALSPGINASTWLTYLVTGVLQGILLAMCIYYQYFERSRSGGQYTIISNSEAE